MLNWEEIKIKKNNNNNNQGQKINVRKVKCRYHPKLKTS